MVETVTDFIFLGFKITPDGYCSQEIQICLLLGRKAMTNIDSILKSRDVTFPTKIRFSSVTQSCPTLCDPVYHQLPELAQTHAIELVMPSNCLILCHPLFLLPPIPPSIRVFSNEFFSLAIVNS